MLALSFCVSRASPATHCSTNHACAQTWLATSCSTDSSALASPVIYVWTCADSSLGHIVRLPEIQMRRLHRCLSNSEPCDADGGKKFQRPPLLGRSPDPTVGLMGGPCTTGPHYAIST